MALRQRVSAGLTAAVLALLTGPPARGAEQEVYITATVESFGGYVFSEGLAFDITEPGEQDVGQITVEGIYNGPYPWILRCYTDNLRFGGVIGAVRTSPPAGLVSEDGRYAIPLLIHSPNFGVGVFLRIPDINEPDYVPYSPNPEEAPDVGPIDRVIMGIDPRNPTWVAGPDEVLYTLDDNPLGDTTIETPFTLTLRADVPPAAVQGKYRTELYFEVVSAP